MANDESERDESVERGFEVHGRVQGVGFRWWTRMTAGELGLSGAVRNRPDGAVEVRVRGPAETVDRFRSRLARGPRSARVDDLREIDSELPVSPGAFQIVR